MDERVVQFRVGVMVFSTGLIATILVLLLGDRPALFQESYTIEVHLDDAPNVSRNTPIRKSGIMIGRVSEVKFAPQGGVLITASIDKGVKIAANETCQVKETLLGDAELQFTLPHGERPSSIVLQPGALVEGKTVPDPMQIVADLQGGLADAVESVSRTSDKLSEVADQIGNMFERNETTLDDIVNQTNEALKNVNEVVGYGSELLGDDKFRERLTNEIKQLPGTFQEVNETVATLRGSVDRMNHSMALVDENLENIRDLTEPLGESGPKMIENVNSSVQRLNNLMCELETFSCTLNSNRGTLGKLINDPELYDHINRTISQVEQLGVQIRPIVNDMRIFSDQLARHPGSVLRDAVKPGPGLKGLPPLLDDERRNCPPESRGIMTEWLR